MTDSLPPGRVLRARYPHPVRVDPAKVAERFGTDVETARKALEDAGFVHSRAKPDEDKTDR